MSFIKLIVLLFIIKVSSGFYYTADENDINSDLVKDLKIYVSNLNETFPRTFILTFTHEGYFYNNTFTKFSSYQNSYDIYVIGPETKQPKKYELLDDFSAENYHLTNGEGFARLIKNDQSFSLIASLKCENDTSVYLDIMPINVIHIRNKRYLTKEIKRFDSEKNNHFVKKRLLRMEFDNLNATRNIKINQRPKRALNGQPIEFNIELLVVTDSDVYKNFQTLAGNSNQQIVFQLMRHYYAHLINGVNQRYQVSLANDPDIRINVILTNFFFLTMPFDEQWISSSVDPIYPTYNGKQTIVNDKAYQNFANYINSLKFPFNFDHAAGLFNKEILSNDYSTSIQNRAKTAGFCPGLICTQDKYSINEDFGGLSNLLTIAHYIGHNLGSVHDGFGLAVSCPFQQNNIMAPLTSGESTHRFSICSINQFKSLLLNPSLNGVSEYGQCLLNIPKSKANETDLIQDKLPGDFLSPDDQCKMIYGSTASFCTSTLSVICRLLYCRPNSISTDCFGTNGAVDGTLCDSGKVCQSGSCVEKKTARTGTCLQGDDLIGQALTGLNLPSPQVKCSDYFNLIIQAKQSVSGTCNDNRIERVCCKSCKKYRAMICKDLNWNCPNYANACFGQLNIQGVIYKIRDICPRTCSACPATPLRCEQAPNICENGGTCTNINVPETSEFGFRCVCPSGYSGDICEVKTPNSCLANPCKNGGTCQPFGSLGYICICRSECSGYDCNQCKNNSLLTTRPNNPSTTSFNVLSTTRKNTNACANNPCQNGGTCQLTSAGFFCLCTSECSGETCSSCKLKDFHTEICKAVKEQSLCSSNVYIGSIPIIEACALSCSSIDSSTTQSTTLFPTTRPNNPSTTRSSSNRSSLFTTTKEPTVPLYFYGSCKLKNCLNILKECARCFGEGQCQVCISMLQKSI